METTEMPFRHPVLPPNLHGEALEEWLKRYSSERSIDQVKNFFTDEQKSTMAMASSRKGAEIINLEKIMADVKKAIEGGVADADLIVTIPVTDGTKLLKSTRVNLDQDVTRGYILEEREIFGVKDTDAGEMVYFDKFGNEIAERHRPLSAREQNDTGRLFLGLGKTGTNG